jgi:hypothetical protein
MTPTPGPAQADPLLRQAEAAVEEFMKVVRQMGQTTKNLELPEGEEFVGALTKLSAAMDVASKHAQSTGAPLADAQAKELARALQATTGALAKLNERIAKSPAPSPQPTPLPNVPPQLQPKLPATWFVPSALQAVATQAQANQYAGVMGKYAAPGDTPRSRQLPALGEQLADLFRLLGIRMQVFFQSMPSTGLAGFFKGIAYGAGIGTAAGPPAQPGAAMMAGNLLTTLPNALTALPRMLAHAGISGMVAGVKSLSGTLKEMTEHTKGAVAAFNNAEHGLGRFAHAASPALWGTFTGSLDLLAGRLGQLLIPMILKASLFIQQLADYIANLDEGTKETIRSWLALGAGVLAGGAILSMFASFISPIISLLNGLLGVLKFVAVASIGLFKGIVTGIQTMAAYLGMNPLGALLLSIGLVVAAVAGIATAFARAGSSIKDATARAHELDEVLDKIGRREKITRKDITKLSAEDQERFARAGSDPAKQKRLLEQFREEGRQKLATMPDEEAMLRQRAALQTFLHQRAGERMDPGIWARFGKSNVLRQFFESQGQGGEEAEQSARKLAGRMKGLSGSEGRIDAEKIGQVLDAFMDEFKEAQVKMGIAEQGIAQGGIAPTGEQERGGGAMAWVRGPGGKPVRSRVTMDTQQEIAPGFMALEEARRSIQKELVGHSPIELEKLNLQRETLRQMQADEAAEATRNEKRMRDAEALWRWLERNYRIGFPG